MGHVVGRRRTATARYLADYGATVVRLDSSYRPGEPAAGTARYKDGGAGLNNTMFYGDYNASSSASA